MLEMSIRMMRKPSWAKWRNQDMDAESTITFRRRTWRGALLGLVTVPFLPEIAIILTSFYAAIVGCDAGADEPCAMGSTLAIRAALTAASLISGGFGPYLITGWLLLCYPPIILGWSRLSSRLLLGFCVSLTVVVTPYVGPNLSVGYLANKRCIPNTGGIPPECPIYGGEVGEIAHAAVGWLDRIPDMGWFPFVCFFFFVIFVIFSHFKKAAAERAS